jgi:hypothetical protein
MAHLKLLDLKSAFCQKSWNVTSEVTTFKRPIAQRLQPLLPALDLRIG